MSLLYKKKMSFGNAFESEGMDDLLIFQKTLGQQIQRGFIEFLSVFLHHFQPFGGFCSIAISTVYMKNHFIRHTVIERV